MKMIAKDQVKRLDDAAAKLRTTESKLAYALEGYNNAVLAAHEKLKETVEEYNEVLREADDAVKAIGSDIESEIEGRSEKWQESERGEAFTRWKDAFNELEVTEVEIEDHVDLELDYNLSPDDLEMLPRSVDEA